MNNQELELIQRRIEYTFTHPRLLRQAFTRSSYAEENGGEDNEVLEFYGDKALEFVVMRKLCDWYGSATDNGDFASDKREGQLTEIKKRLVGRKMLASRVDALGLSQYLLVSKGDEAQGIREQESVKEDLFEAIVGAVAIDCGWDSDCLEEVLDRLLDVEYYLENGFDDDENYVDLVQNWCQKKHGCLPTYFFSETYNGFSCQLVLPDGADNPPYVGFFFSAGFHGDGSTKREARMIAARKAYEDLDRRGMLILPIDEVGYPDRDRAINQLQELYQKGFIAEPKYVFKETYDRGGNPLWRCECHVADQDIYCYDDYTSKKAGKKDVAYDMLCHVLGVKG